MIEAFTEFTPVRMVASNSHVETWIVERRRGGKQTLLKTPSSESSYDPHRLQQVLVRSYEAQRSLRSPLINRAISLHKAGKYVAVEYPFLAGPAWQPLGSDFGPLPIVECLALIALTLDFLHLSGNVHGDLKPENFMYRVTTDGAQLRLVDLDFLSPAGRSPEARIFGTPGRIAPEILANQFVLPQSDAYSLGMALRSCFQWSDQQTSAEVTGRLKVLADELSQADYMRRPKDLLAALRRHEVIDEPTYLALNRRLVVQVVLSNYRVTGRNRLQQRQDIENFLHRKCRILGLSNEMVLATGMAAERDYRRSRRAFVGLFAASQLTRAGVHFFAQPDDGALLAAYDEFRGVLDSGESGEEQESFFAHANWPEAALLAGLKNLRDQKAGEGHTEEQLKLASRAYELNRLSLADTLFKEAMNATIDLGRYLGYLEAAVGTLVRLARYDAAEELIERGVKASRAAKDSHTELLLTRILGWLRMIAERIDEARELLDDVRARSQELHYKDIEAQIEYTFGVMHWRHGRFREACIQFERAIVYTEDVDSRVHISALSTLALAKLAVAENQASIQAAKTAINLAVASNQRTLIAPTCIVLIGAYARLAEFDKAEYWLRRLYSEITPSSDPIHLFNYHQMSAFVAIWRGDLLQAEESCAMIMETARLVPRSLRLVKGYYTLAETAMLRGDRKRLEANLELGRDLCRQFDDIVSAAELDIIGYSSRLVYGEPVDKKAIYATIDLLLNRQSYFYAALGIFHLLAEGEPIGEAMRQRREQLRPVIAHHEVPMFRVLSALLYLNEAGDFNDQLNAWKQAFVELHQKGDIFRAMIAARRLSDLYLEHHRTRPARKFLLQTRRLADRLQNNIYRDRTDPLIAALTTEPNSQATLIESFYAVSEVLKQSHDYPRMLYKLAQCAVDQTGAERGVILLNTGSATGLRVVASYNCDDDSLSDIVDFSRSIPRTVATQSSTVLIDDATKDGRTRSLKSVIAHNILSVAAVPLSVDGHVLGVLYLDHHAIPSLFEESDKRYIDAIANFVSVVLTNAQAYRILQTKSDQLEQRLEKLGELGKFVSRDPKILEIFEQLDRIAQTTAPVLLLGASGTGKEIMAERIHSLSSRAKRALVKLNCAALAPNLVESELFGIAKSVATSVAEREGRLAAAEGGTLFLDEIGDMPLEVQAKLLRVVEYQEYEKVGSNRVIHSDIRFICATHRDLCALIADGKFREDLYFRINTVTVEIPPLHRRPEDIPLLVNHFIRLLANGAPPVPTPETIGLLSVYPWPGNVRELRNLIERWCILLPGKAVTPVHLPDQIRDVSAPGAVAAAAALEEVQVRQAFKRFDGNQSRAAESLGMSLSTFRRKLKKYGLL